MDEEQTIKRPSKHDRVNFLSKVYCTWIYSTFIKGLKRDVEINDLYKCPKSDESEELVLKLERNWDLELKKKNPSFLKANIKTFISPLLPVFLFHIFEECFLKNAQPVLLGLVIRFFANSKNESYMTACLSAAGVVLASLFYCMTVHPACFLAVRIALKARVSWCTLMYKKALKLKPSAFGKTTVGQILNLMSNDVSRFDEYCLICTYFIVSPLQSIIGLYICWIYIGPISLIGFAILLLFIPFNSLMGRLFLKIRTKVAALSDNRIRLMNEIIKGMRVIKMYAWERHFSNLISEARKKEMSRIRQSTLLRGLNISISIIAARVILFAIFITYALIGGHLRAEPVFVTMSIFNTLRHTMTWLFPNSIALAAEIYVSCGRVQKFLTLEEVEDRVIDNKVNDNNNTNGFNKNDLKDNNLEIIQNNINNNCNENERKHNYSVIVDNITAKWIEDSEYPTLKDISLRIKPGELLAVIGPVGSGKSSFLMSLLNEIQLTSGSVSVNGSIAYASQESWSFNSSILQNIMFGKPYEQNRFREVISVCAMKRDLQLFPYAERTLVGERGVSLSGGQKARITLARALYNDADIYLLDDPLSAVDSEVANHIFEKCITEYLKAKTVILVTHQIQFIKKATKILVLKDGKPLAFGSYDELIQSGIDFMSLIKEEKEDKENEDKKDVVNSEDLLIQEQFLRQRTISVLSVKSEVDIKITNPKVEDENKAIGSINAKVYWNYVRAGAGPVLLMLALVSTLISQGLFHYLDIWISEWTNREDARNESSDEVIDQTNNIIIYSSLVAATFITLLIRSLTFFMMCTIASINLHNSIFFNLMRTPIAFFDNNPIGRILNRFTKDVGIVDEQLPLCSYDLNLIVTQVVGSIIVVALVNWYLIIPAILMIILILQIRWIYIKTGRDLKRFEGMARSPIYNHMTTTLNGLATIRAFRAQDLFRKQYYRYQNDHTATYFLCVCGSRALGIMMDWICMIYIFCVALFLMIFHEGLPSGSAGLAFTMALGMTGMTQWGVRQSAEVENQMTSVERILEYSRLETEPELESSNNKPLEDWPQKGSIKLSKVYLTYENSPKPVLFDLNCEISGGEKIGIVGRTGAGKSSILSALFRMHEIQGNIFIDGIDCKTIGLHDLRKKMSIIPQDPIAFIGSLRKNLDPFNEHSEDKLWEVLEEVQLKDAVNEMPAKLEYQLSESGGNLSVGQRQLICLARAILRRNKILVLDEATANVDHKTDSLIQKTIRHNFANCTVLTIAHRLNTIIDSDRVLVLDSGKIVEFDVPYILLQNNKGLFFKLVKQTGLAMSEQLFKSAKEAFDKNNALKVNINTLNT